MSPSDAGMGSPSVMAVLCPSCGTQHGSVGTTRSPQPHHPNATAWGQGGDHHEHQPRGAAGVAPKTPAPQGDGRGGTVTDGGGQRGALTELQLPDVSSSWKRSAHL